MSINEQLRSMMPTDKTSRELAKEFGVTPQRMNDWLTNAGLEAGWDYAETNSGWGVNWAAVDWTQRNIDIASHYRRDQRYVANMRKKHAPSEFKSSRRLTRLKK